MQTSVTIHLSEATVTNHSLRKVDPTDEPRGSSGFSLSQVAGGSHN